jgi:ribonuclease P protein component
MDRAVPNEADVQASQSEASQQARVPREDEDSGRAGHPLTPSEERARAPRSEAGDQVDAREPGVAERLPRCARIRHTEEIRALLDRGKRKRTKHVDVFLATSPVPFSRLGVVVAKHGRGSVERNRLKRRVREIGRRSVLPALAERGLTVDVLVRTRGEAYGAAFAVLEEELREAVEALCSDAS